MKISQTGFGLALALALTLPTPARAGTFTIADGDVSGLIAALVAAGGAAGSDEILLATNGNYVLTAADNALGGPNGLPAIEDTVIIRGNGATLRRATNAPNFRFFYVTGVQGLTGNLTLDQLVLTNGVAGQGSAGGAVYTESGVVTLLNGCQLVGNAADAGGGALSTFDGTVTVRDSRFEANSTASFGGAIHVSGSKGSLTLSNCVVTGNNAANAGGAFYLFPDGGALAQFTDCTINANSAGEHGGGLASGIELRMTGCTISSNITTVAGGMGGGLSHFSGDAALVNCTFSGNSATGPGGGIYVRQSFEPSFSMVLTNVTVTGNIADADGVGGQGVLQDGGGVFVDVVSARPAGGPSTSQKLDGLDGPSTLYLVNTLIAGNQDLSSGQGAFNRPDLAGAPVANIASLDYNLISRTNDVPFVPQPHDQCGSLAAPIDPLLGPLLGNGGPTLTHALLAGSPAIGAGNPALTTNLPPFDQRGPGFPRISGSRADLGAFEKQLLPQTIAFTQTNKTYGDGPFGFIATADSGLPVSFTLVSGPILLAGSKVNIKGAGSVTIRASQSGDATYAPAPDVELTFDILTAPLTVAADNKFRPYGATNPPLTLTYTGFVYGETNDVLATLPTVQSSAAPTNDVGLYPIVVFGGSDTNYSFSYVTGQLNVTSAPLTAKADDAARVYGATNSPFTISYTGFVNNEDAGVLDQPPIATTTATPASPVGGYPISLSAATDNNYTVTVQSGTLTVTQAILVVSANPTNRLYGRADPPFTGTIAGLQNNDAITTAFSTTATATSPVGGYPITPALADPDGKLVNYLVSTNAGILTINKAPLTAKADNKTKLLGQAVPPLTISYTGFANDENASVIDVPPVAATLATVGSDLGNYLITLNCGSDNNYDLILESGTLAVIPAELPVTVGGIFFSNQTGLYVQHVTVSNPYEELSVTAVRLILTNWSAVTNAIPDARAHNAAGFTNGLPYVQSNLPLPPGGSVTFSLEYFVPTRRALNPAPAFRAEVVVAAAGANPTGTVQTLNDSFNRSLFLPGGFFLIEFQSQTNRNYYVQYAATPEGPWKTALPFVAGNGTQIQWLDSGPPKTESPPASAGARYYRVLWQPR